MVNMDKSDDGSIDIIDDLMEECQEEYVKSIPAGKKERTCRVIFIADHVLRRHHH